MNMEFSGEFQKRGVELGLLTKQADIEDTEHLSKYFVLQEFSPELTSGKNSITFNGSEYLKKGSEVLVECLDSEGESLYIESTTKTSTIYRESSAYILSVHIYNNTANGAGKLILYGTAANGQTVKWVGNIVIDKTKQNSSTVRFYEKPVLEVHPILSNIISTTAELTNEIEYTGSFYSYAANPLKDSPKLSEKNTEIDYRIYSKLPYDINPTKSFNIQMTGLKADFMPKKIQEPFVYNNINTNFSSSISIRKVVNGTTIILDSPIYYPDKNKNDVVVNVVDGNFYIKYPYVSYNTASESSSYLTMDTSNGNVFIKQSYADVIYRNLKTFSGFVARHKLYRKSLFAAGDFEVIADDPLVPYEILQDNLTVNKSFDKMGWFYNQLHLDKYWFSTGSLQMTQSSEKLINGLIINNKNNNNSTLDSIKNYIIVKNNSSHLYRNATYYPYVEKEYLASSGSFYDSNFIEIKKNVNYIISLNAILKKDISTMNEVDAGLEFYFTSSFPEINSEKNSIRNQKGLLKLGTLYSNKPIKEKTYTNATISFTTQNDLYGTLLIVPKKCTAVISEVSMKPYGSIGFSPDVLIARIPFPINVANETYELKAELYDINSNLVYSDLRTISSFDVSGSSLILYIPGLKDPSKTTYISGSLRISGSLEVGGNTKLEHDLNVLGTVQIGDITESTYTVERMLSWHPNSKYVKYTNVNDIENVGTEEVVVKLYNKPPSLDRTTRTPYRLIPSVKGRSVFVPPL